MLQSNANNLDIKVIITPFFESRIKARIKFITHLFLNGMEVLDILVNDI